MTPLITTAYDYDDISIQAVRSVLLELGQVLGSYRDCFVIIGGAVPSLLLPDAEPPHLGTIDIDLNLDPSKLGNGEYASFIELLEHAGYERSSQDLRPFQLRREVSMAGREPVSVVVDLLIPRNAKFKKNRPRLMAHFRAIEADGADAALRSFVEHRITGHMPDGRANQVTLRVASIPALLVMKGYAIDGRDKRKDAYDIYYSVRNYPGGGVQLAKDCAPLLSDPVAVQGFLHIAEKFDSAQAYGPASVRQFLVNSPASGEMTPEQIQQDAYRQVRAWLDQMPLDRRR